MSKEEYLDSTERELFALSIASNEMNGMQTELNDGADLMSLLS